MGGVRGDGSQRAGPSFAAVKSTRFTGFVSLSGPGQQGRIQGKGPDLKQCCSLATRAHWLRRREREEEEERPHDHDDNIDNDNGASGTQ